MSGPPTIVRIRGTQGTFHYHGPSARGNALWCYGPIGSQQRQWRAVTADQIRFVTAKAKPKPKPARR